MAIEPATYNFEVQRRADWSTIFEFKDSSNSAINLTGATVIMQAWNKERTKKYADFAVAYTDRANGKVTLALTDAQTEWFPASMNYDLLIQDSAGLREYYLEGIVTVKQGYSS